MAQDPFSLVGAQVMIVGASGGVGRATARTLARMGAALWLADRDPPRDLAAELMAQGATVTARGCDVSVRAEVEALVDAAPRPDAVIFAAAICPWDDWTTPGWDDAYREVMDVNLKGAVDLARAALRRMAGHGGRIVLVSSLAGRTGGLVASPHYVASKGGLNALVKWLAQRGAPEGVLVNGVAPASVRTPMMDGQSVDLARIPLGRMAEPHEVAGPIAFLCAPASSYMTGTILDVNGGVHMA